MNLFINNHQCAFLRQTQSIHHFRLIPTTDNPTHINVVASLSDDFNHLQLSYFISSTFVLTKPQMPIRADFLWEKTCLECFFECREQGYIELNFAPSGEYNLYRFQNYRSPNTLPPVWADGEILTKDFPLDNYHTYHICVVLNHTNFKNITRINPTAIIYQDDAPTFYAVQHANPPDFHDKNFWQSFKL